MEDPGKTEAYYHPPGSHSGNRIHGMAFTAVFEKERYPFRYSAPDSETIK